MNYHIPSPLEKFTFYPSGNSKRQLFIKRDDLIHPLVSGNKWRKLQMHFAQFKSLGMENVVTCGGPWSNHILATAAACTDYKLRCTGLIRGDYYPEVNPLLQIARQLGMDIQFLSNNEYKTLQTTPEEVLADRNLLEAHYIPMGGSGKLGQSGCTQIVEEILDANLQPDLFVLAIGTGTTLAGILTAISWPCEVLIYPAIHRHQEIERIRQVIDESGTSATCHFLPGHRCPFGKVDKQLVQFIHSFFRQTGILLDPIYNGKMMETFLSWQTDSIHTGQRLNEQSTAVAYHSGGLGGWYGVHHRYPDQFDLTFALDHIQTSHTTYMR